VLGKWTKEEEKGLPPLIDTSIEVIKSFGTLGIERTMNLYNTKPGGKTTTSPA
jgi:PTH1 family peptidyl-tRNA hydrolase